MGLMRGAFGLMRNMLGLPLIGVSAFANTSWPLMAFARNVLADVLDFFRLIVTRAWAMWMGNFFFEPRNFTNRDGPDDWAKSVFFDRGWAG